MDPYKFLSLLLLIHLIDAWSNVQSGLSSAHYFRSEVPYCNRSKYSGSSCCKRYKEHMKTKLTQRLAEEDKNEFLPVTIKVIGIGGAGGNAINGMISTTKTMKGVEFIAMNTDQQALFSSLAKTKISLGGKCTGGLGAGGRPDVGAAAAEESREDIIKCLLGADMVFITSGMGGGTGTGAAPVVAQLARELGCLTVGVVTSPFKFEGNTRARQAAEGLALLQQHLDSLLVVANDKLLEIIPSNMAMTDAFLVADDILRQCVIGTSELILRPGLINVDFADVRSVLGNSGSALIGIGTGVGSTRAQDAAVGAISSPLLDYPILGASGILFNIVGGPDLTLSEVSAAARVVQENVHPDANIIIGAMIDERAGKEVQVTVIATGFQKSISNFEEYAEKLQEPQFEPYSNQNQYTEAEGHGSVEYGESAPEDLKARKKGIFNWFNR